MAEAGSDAGDSTPAAPQPAPSGGGRPEDSLPAGGDTGDGTVLASGEVNYDGRSHRLVLTAARLRLLTTPTPSQAAGQSADGPPPVLDVAWREVICACQPAPGHRSKTSAGDRKADGAEAAASSRVFVVHCMARHAKTHKVTVRSLSLDTTQDTAEGWVGQIEERRKEGKPQKLLVIINPIGGHGKGRQVFAKQVQPLFVLAGVELVVKVTEREKHALEMIKSFDVTSVDGVVVMGGDGMYMEVLHALTLLRQEEGGVDYHLPHTPLLPPTLRIGIIPTGSANGMSSHCNGVIDMDTATLNIIRGETDRANLFAVHQGGQLVQYGGLFFANGFFATMARRTQELRWMKMFRYGYVMLALLFGEKKVLEFDVEVLRGDEDQGDKPEDGKVEGAEAASPSGWVKLGSKRVTSLFFMVSRLMADPNGLFVINPFRPNFDLLCLRCTSAMDLCRFIHGFYTHQMSYLERPFVEWVRNIRGLRFRLVQPLTTTEGAASRQTETEEMDKLLNVDGEVVSLSQPTCEIRMHPQFLQVFAFTEHFNKVTPPS
ncbi:hypothetical protein ACOMHN_006497 [Nucella lapillus]